MNRPLILVTNDDGITAPGIRFLINIMSEIGDVYVVDPDKAQSGMGHAITINGILQVEKIKINGNGAIAEWKCTGTPVDCVKIAIEQLLPRKPDLCVSGVNHGSNSSINVIYSGTMSAAMKGCIEGVDSIGFSLCDFSYNADFNPSRKYIKRIVKKVLEKGLPEGIALNVNIPKAEEKDIKGIKICRQAKAIWKEEFDKRTNPKGKDYYWMTGEFVNIDEETNTDEWALTNNFISIVPIIYDLTAYNILDDLEGYSF